jgi:hypothetical protein
MKRWTLALAFAVPLALVACDKSSESKTEGEPSAQTNTTGASAKADPHAMIPPPAPVPAVSPADTLADSDLVTAADMEEEAERTITAKNYKTEIASLEAELAKE